MWAPAAQFGRDPRPGTKLTQPGPPAPPTPRKETPTQDGVCSVIFTCTHAGAQGTAKELASEELDHAGPATNVLSLSSKRGGQRKKLEIEFGPQRTQ
ncbi:unnamed protein product [Boreogadus saida]